MQPILLEKMNRYIFIFLFIWLSHPITSLAQDTTQIKFPNSGKAQAQQAFLQGVLFLHSFAYEDAAEAFGQAKQKDPDFALAYWGEAMSYNHPIWGGPPDREKAIACLNKLAATPEGRLAKAPTEREKGFLKAIDALYNESDEKKIRDLAYLKAMEQLYLKHPDDLEVASFYVLAHLGVGNIDRASEIAQKVLNKNPDHPGALHYYIHCNDHPERAHLALEAANRYPKVAAYAAHALHMPSHIFAALGKWDGVVSSNEQSMAAADDRMKRKALGVEQRDYHSIWWLVFGYLQQGRYKDALSIIKQVEGNASQSDDHFIRNNLTFMRAHYIVESKDYNHELLQRPMKIADLHIDNQATVYFTDGYAAAQRGDLSTARQALASMNVALSKTSNHAPEKDSHNHHHGTGDTSSNQPIKYSLAALLQKELQALILVKEGKIKEGEKTLQEAIQIQSQRPALSVPIFIKPANELLGEILLTLNRPLEAKAAFQSALKMAPNRVLSLQGLMKAAEQSGDKRLAVETQTLVRNIRWQEEASAMPENKENKP